MALFNDPPYFCQYWNKKLKGKPMKHSTMCENAAELKRIINTHNKDWEFEVWELVELNKEELEEVLGDA